VHAVGPGAGKGTAGAGRRPGMHPAQLPAARLAGPRRGAGGADPVARAVRGAAAHAGKVGANPTPLGTNYLGREATMSQPFRRQGLSPARGVLLGSCLAAIVLAGCGTKQEVPVTGPPAAPKQAPPNALELLFTYGSEKATWIKEVTDA